MNFNFTIAIERLCVEKGTEQRLRFSLINLCVLFKVHYDFGRFAEEQAVCLLWPYFSDIESINDVRLQINIATVVVHCLEGDLHNSP